MGKELIKRLAYSLSGRGLLNWMSDRRHLEFLYGIEMSGEKHDFDNPVLFTEKLQWYKLYYHDPLFHRLVDKYEIKTFVEEKLGPGYTLPCLGVWDKFDDINFDILPDQFVLKCTHDSGSAVICRDKSSFDIGAARRKIKRAQSRDYFCLGREWAYKGVKPRIIAEPFEDTLGNLDSVEYKLTCMNGEVKVFTVCTGIAHSSFSVRHNDNFSRDFKPQNWYAFYTPSGKQDIQKPKFFDEMIEFSEKLSAGIPEVRVDWYVAKGKLYFGEMTFYTWSGFIDFQPREWNRILGDWFVLPEKKL